jgi:hypothetical protein
METMMSNQIGDCENPPIFPGAENWLGFRTRARASCCLCEEHRKVGGSSPNKDNNSPSPFCVIESMPASRLQTVFSITQSDHSISHTKPITVTENTILKRETANEKGYTGKE